MVTLIGAISTEIHRKLYFNGLCDEDEYARATTGRRGIQGDLVMRELLHTSVYIRSSARQASRQSNQAPGSTLEAQTTLADHNGLW